MRLRRVQQLQGGKAYRAAAAETVRMASRAKNVREIGTASVSKGRIIRSVRRMGTIWLSRIRRMISSGVKTSIRETAIIATSAEEVTGDAGRKDKHNKMTHNLKGNERIDDLQRNGYRIIQDPERFCFGMDAVLLAGFAYAREEDRLLDLGTGTGIIPLLMEARYHCAQLTGLEIQPESADMAARSVALNNLSDRIHIVTGDIKEADSLFPSASFDCITCNPPYMIGNHGITNPDAPKAIARHEILCTLEDVVRQTAKLLKPGGHFFLVHRPFRLAEIMVTLVKYKLEPKRMQLVYPYVDKEPNMVLLEAVRGGKSRMTVEKPLIVYSEPGVYMPEIYDIYGY